MTLPVPSWRRNPWAGRRPQSRTAVMPASGEEGELQAALLRRRQPLELGRLHLALVGAEARRDDALGDPGAERRDQEGRGDHEVVVAGRVDLVAGQHDARRLLREAGEQRVDRAEQKVRAVPARHSGESRRHADDRMAADRLKDDAGERDEEDIPDFAGGIRHDAAEDDRQGQELARRAEYEQPQQGTDEAARLADADADEGHQDRPEWREAGEVGHRLAQDPVQAVDRQQRDRADRLAGDRVHRDQIEPQRDVRGDDDEERQQREQRRGMRQRIPGTLDAGEKTFERRALRARLGCCRRLGHRRIVRNRAAARKLDPRSEVERRPLLCGVCR